MTEAPHGLVSLARCAELLTQAGDRIERSALSRYCDTHNLKGPKVGREVHVDFEAVQAHRRENYQRQVMTGGKEIAPGEHARPVQPASGEQGDLAPLAASSQPPSASVTPIPLANDPARELKSMELRRRQREEALEEGRLTDVAEVDAGLADAVVILRAAFAEVRADTAEALAAQLGVPPEKVRALRAGLKRYDRVGQERFAARLAKVLQDANEPGNAAQVRLIALAAHAMRLRGRPVALAAADVA